VKLVEAIKSFINLRSVQFTPQTYHEDLFRESLIALRDLRSLTEIAVNTSCTDDAKASALVGLCGLKKLTLCNPSRAILQLLPDWLRRLSGTLQELHLKVNHSPRSMFDLDMINDDIWFREIAGQSHLVSSDSSSHISKTIYVL
jgi:hypothetical protein